MNSSNKLYYGYYLHYQRHLFGYALLVVLFASVYCYSFIFIPRIDNLRKSIKQMSNNIHNLERSVTFSSKVQPEKSARQYKPLQEITDQFMYFILRQADLQSVDLQSCSFGQSKNKTCYDLQEFNITFSGTLPAIKSFYTSIFKHEIPVSIHRFEIKKNDKNYVCANSLYILGSCLK